MDRYGYGPDGRQLGHLHPFRAELLPSGAYARVRHPQYDGFLLIMTGFLLQWPTLVTVLMYPLLVLAYRRLEASEEREVERQFAADWIAYAAVTPRFEPRRARRVAPPTTGVPAHG